MEVHLIRVLAMLAVMGMTLLQIGRLPRPRPPLFVWLGMSTGLAFVVESIGLVTALNGVPNNALYNAFVLVEFLLVLAMIRTVRRGWTPILIATGLAGLLSVAWSYSVQGSLDFLLTEGIVALSLLLTVLVLAVLIGLALRSTLPIHRSPTFWLFMGLLVYFGGLPPLLTMSRYFYGVDTLLADRLWSIPSMLCVIRYLLCFVAARMAYRGPHG